MILSLLEFQFKLFKFHISAFLHIYIYIYCVYVCKKKKKEYEKLFVINVFHPLMGFIKAIFLQQATKKYFQFDPAALMPTHCLWLYCHFTSTPCSLFPFSHPLSLLLSLALSFLTHISSFLAILHSLFPFLSITHSSFPLLFLLFSYSFLPIPHSPLLNFLLPFSLLFSLLPPPPLSLFFSLSPTSPSLPSIVFVCLFVTKII